MPVINASLDSFEFKERVIKEGESNFRKEIPKEVQNNAQNHEKSTKPIKVDVMVSSSLIRHQSAIIEKQ